ncbi:MAG: hydrogenase expression/formation protein HypE [Phycisphaerales bacterium]|nr:hydrogenase expression/formation protein HypE [Phycisphaerales bacterium]
MSETAEFTASCPVPMKDYPRVLLAHGGGGTLMRELIEKIFLPAFDNDELAQRHDAAVVEVGSTKLAFTTDSYVVHPLFFPGGDIGSLAVHGTVNDLAMSGARPLYLSTGFIIEEGLPMETLSRVVQSMRDAAHGAGVRVITGDTKVVDKGKADGVFINTAGVGVIEHALDITPRHVRPGDAVILSGDIGRHGIAIMAQREGLEFESEIESDSAIVSDLVMSLLSSGMEIHCMRDLTRGGLASALNEIADAACLSMEIDECSIPIREDVRGACEMLGLDPLYVACEGRFVVFVPPEQAARTIELMNGHVVGRDACVVGVVSGSRPPTVTMRSRIGASRIIDMLSGEQLPRIC